MEVTVHIDLGLAVCDSYVAAGDDRRVGDDGTQS